MVLTVGSGQYFALEGRKLRGECVRRILHGVGLARWSALRNSGAEGHSAAETTTDQGSEVGGTPAPVSASYPTDSGGNSRTENLGPVPACELYQVPDLDGMEAMRWPRRF